MEMVCKAARSVKIVVLVSFFQICRSWNIFGNLIPNPSSEIYWLVNQHHLNRHGSAPLTEDAETQIRQEISGEIQRIWEEVKGVEVPGEDSQPTPLGKAERRTITAIRECPECWTSSHWLPGSDIRMVCLAYIQANHGNSSNPNLENQIRSRKSTSAIVWQ
jgi:hypothetical protein